MSDDATIAERGVAPFHALLDVGDFDRIYDQSSEEMKATGTKADFVALLSAVHRKLGTTRTVEKMGWLCNYGTKGTFVTLNYKTMFARGGADEQFVFRIQGQEAALAGYHVNSNALVVD